MRIQAFLAVMTLSPAFAQGLILRPTQPTVQVKTTRPSDIPADWRALSGSIRAAQSVSLPAGSTIQVSVEKVEAGKTVIASKINFAATKLPNAYQMYYNPAKLGGGKYMVVARVMDAAGRTLFYSKTAAPLPQAAKATVDLNVVPVR